MLTTHPLIGRMIVHLCLRTNGHEGTLRWQALAPQWVAVPGIIRINALSNIKRLIIFLKQGLYFLTYS